VLFDDISPDMGRLGGDGVSALSRPDVLQEAQEIIAALNASRLHRVAFEDNWRKLWQLLREARAACLPFGGSTHGPWHFSRAPEAAPAGGSLRLMAGNLFVPIWPTEGFRPGSELPGLLNSVGVPIPDGQ
jgi:hypothetical protein